jgi:hypothetical protein
MHALFKSQFDNFGRVQIEAAEPPVPNISITRTAGGLTTQKDLNVLKQLLSINAGPFFDIMIATFSKFSLDKMEVYGKLRILVHEMRQCDSQNDANLVEVLHRLQLNGNSKRYNALNGNNDTYSAVECVNLYLGRLFDKDATIKDMATIALSELEAQSHAETGHGEFFKNQLERIEKLKEDESEIGKENKESMSLIMQLLISMCMSNTLWPQKKHAE